MTDAYAMQIADTLSTDERAYFLGAYGSRERDFGTAMLLAVLGGWLLGLHKFYLRRPVQGALHILFAPTGIPLILTIFDLFTMRKTVLKVNQQIADEIATSIRFKSLQAY